MTEQSANTLSKKEHNIGRFLMAATAILWGLAGVCVKSITWNSFSLMAARSVISLLMLAAVKKASRQRLQKPICLAPLP